jgi:hypothetical protein
VESAFDISTLVQWKEKPVASVATSERAEVDPDFRAP